VGIEIATNGPAFVAAVGLESPTYLGARERSFTNEPTNARENATNEPTDASDVGPDGPTYMNAPTQNSTNEATVACDNVTNEPTLSMPSGESQVQEVRLARRPERRLRTGERGSARAVCSEPRGAGTGWEQARAEPRTPKKASNPPARGREPTTVAGTVTSRYD
jgi:hypothetical protein